MAGEARARPSPTPYFFFLRAPRHGGTRPGGPTSSPWVALHPRTLAARARVAAHRAAPPAGGAPSQQVLSPVSFLVSPDPDSLSRSSAKSGRAPTASSCAAGTKPAGRRWPSNASRRGRTPIRCVLGARGREARAEADAAAGARAGVVDRRGGAAARRDPCPPPFRPAPGGWPPPTPPAPPHCVPGTHWRLGWALSGRLTGWSGRCGAGSPAHPAPPHSPPRSDSWPGARAPLFAGSPISPFIPPQTVRKTALREARTLAAMSHDHIVSLRDQVRRESGVVRAEGGRRRLGRPCPSGRARAPATFFFLGESKARRRRRAPPCPCLAAPDGPGAPRPAAHPHHASPRNVG